MDIFLLRLATISLPNYSVFYLLNGGLISSHLHLLVVPISVPTIPNFLSHSLHKCQVVAASVSPSQTALINLG